MRRIGVLMNRAADDPEALARITFFVQSLHGGKGIRLAFIAAIATIGLLIDPVLSLLTRIPLGLRPFAPSTNATFGLVSCRMQNAPILLA